MNNRPPKNSKQHKADRTFIKSAILTIAVPLLAKGFPLPGKRRLLAKLTQDELAQLNRSRLAYEIKTAEYKLRFGPIWLRIVVQKLREYWLLHRFWIFVSLKVSFSFIVLLLPAFIFWVYRLFLPFPELLDQKGTITPKPARAQYGRWVTERPYSSRGSPLNSILNTSQLEQLEFGKGQTISILPLNQPTEADNAQRIANQPLRNQSNSVILSVRNRLREETEMRAVRLLDPNHPLKLRNAKQNAADILGGNTLKGEFLVFSLSNMALKCRFDLLDNEGHVLFSTEKSPIHALSSDQMFSQFSSIADWYTNLAHKSPRQSLMSQWEEYSFSMDHLPAELTFSLREVDPEGRIVGTGQNSGAETAGAIQSISSLKQQAGSEGSQTTGNRFPGTQNCLAAVSNPVFHKLELSRELAETKNQSNGHGIALIVLDGVSALSARNPSLMPHFTKLQQDALIFNTNFANHTDPNEALRVLLQGSSALLDLSSGPTQTDSAANPSEELIWQESGFESPNLFSEAASLGYKTAFFGDSESVFLRKELNSSGIPDFVSSSTNSHHIAVGAAQAAKEWLTENAQFPFFAVIRLSDIKDRLIPPWKFLEIGRFLLGPFGYSGRNTRYDAMLRYMDSALQFVMESLKTANTDLPVSVAITGSSSLQHQLFNADLENEVLASPHAVKGASFKMGKALLPDNLHVPLAVVHLEKNQTSKKFNNDYETVAESETSYEEKQKPNPIISMSSHITTHELLETMLRNLGQKQENPARHNSPLQLVKGEKTVGILSQRDSSKTLDYWATGNHVFPEQIFDSGFPYGIQRIQKQRPQELFGSYDSVTGSFKKMQPIPKHSLFEIGPASDALFSKNSQIPTPALIFKVPTDQDFSLTLKPKSLRLSYTSIASEPADAQVLKQLVFKVISDSSAVSVIYKGSEHLQKNTRGGLNLPSFQLIIRGLDLQSTSIQLKSAALLTICAKPVEQDKFENRPGHSPEREFNLGKKFLQSLFKNPPMCAFELGPNKTAATELERPIEIEYGWP